MPACWLLCRWRITLLRLGDAEFYRPKWPAQILLEVRRFLEQRGRTKRQIDHRFEQMALAFEDAAISGYEDLIASIRLPDPNDRYVLAAAICGHARTIVTENVKDFPDVETGKFGIGVQTIDAFLMEQHDLEPRLFISVLGRQAAEAGVKLERLVARLRRGFG